jgi:2-(1,2-epoxy-1,2-dihydrophenyl)acetyl-CoA isomerase
MTYSQILYEVADAICTITLNRPDKLNAFTGTMGDEIYTAFQAANADPEVKVIIVTGAGTAFCAGVDSQAMADPQEALKVTTTRLLSHFPVENYNNPKPTICAMNGTAIGVGVTMSLSFDLRVVEAGAKMAVPFAKLGMLPGVGSTHILPQMLGRGRALDILLSSRSFTAEEAYQMGLIERVAPAGKTYETARELALTMAKCDAQTLADVKEMINFGSNANLLQAVENEGKAFVRWRARKAKK